MTRKRQVVALVVMVLPLSCLDLNVLVAIGFFRMAGIDLYPCAVEF